LHDLGISLITNRYHVPKHIQEHVDYVTPGIKLSIPHKEVRSRKRIVATGRPVGIEARQTSTDLSTCYDNVTPDCIRALYEIPPTPEYPNGKPLSNNTLGIYESGDYYLQSDLDLWFTTYQPNVPNGTHPIPAPIDGAVITGNGDPLQNDAGGESNLDLTLGISLIYPQSTTLYQVDDTYYERYGNFTAQFNTFLDAIDGSYCTFSAYGETGNDPVYDPKYPDPNPGGYTKPLQCGVYKPTNVISISYGIQEEQLPAYYQQRQCAEWAKLGLPWKYLGIAVRELMERSSIRDFPTRS
jgi:tripeptidyl-peptidase-1